MYTDDGVSGLSIRRRDGFNRMVHDALDGKIDLILTKSLSRFARNTVDALTTIRKLKAAGVAVYFQRENINTMDSTGEFLLTLMSSFAEEECETPHLTEERLKELFLSALGAYLSDRETVITRLRDTQRVLTDTDFIDEDIRSLEENLTTITGKLRLCITENAANTVTEETYRTAHADLCRRFEETEARLTSLQKQRDRMKADAIAIGGMMFELGELDALPVDFDEKLWQGTIDHVTVHADERVVFRFKDGKEIATRL